MGRSSLQGHCPCRDRRGKDRARAERDRSLSFPLSRFPDARVKIVLPTIPLARQWQTALLHHIKDPSLRPGFYGGGTRDRADRPIMIYIVNSARNTLADHIRRDFALGRRVLLICDECHHYQSPQNRLIFDFARSSFAAGGQYACLGLSATPFDSPDSAVLTDALGPEIYRYDVRQASADGTLYLLDGQTGSLLQSIELEGEINGSPAVFGSTLVIGTQGKNANHIYGISLK